MLCSVLLVQGKVVPIYLLDPAMSYRPSKHILRGKRFLKKRKVLKHVYTYLKLVGICLLGREWEKNFLF